MRRVGVGAELGDDERDPLCHQVGYEGDIAREAVELGDDHRTALATGGREGAGELRPAFERIGALAGGRLDELGDEGEPGRLGEAGDGSLLRLDAET